jgi:hypothetical protein
VPVPELGIGGQFSCGTLAIRGALLFHVAHLTQPS